MDTKALSAVLCAFLLVPLAGSVAPPHLSEIDSEGLQLIGQDQQTTAPVQAAVSWADPGPWWTWTSLDSDRNSIHDSLQTAVGAVNIGLSYAREVTQANREDLARLGFDIHQEVPIVDALLLGDVDASQV